MSETNRKGACGWLLVIAVECSQAGRVPVQVHGLNYTALASTLSHQIAKVLQRNITLLSDTECFVTAVVELLNRSLKTNPE